jgi:hypothetical protein
MIVFPSLSFGTISSSITALLNVFKNYNSNYSIDYFKISDISGYSSYVNTGLPYNLVGSNTGFMTVYNGPGTGGQNAFYAYGYKPEIGLIGYNGSYFSWDSNQSKYISSNSFYNYRLVCCDYKGYEYYEYFDVGYYDIGWNGSLWEMSGVVNEGGAKQSIQTYAGGTQYSIPASFGYRGVPFTARPNVTESNEYINFGIAPRNVTKNRSATISLTQNNSEKLKFNILQSGLGINNQNIIFTNNLESRNGYYFDNDFYNYFVATDQPKSLRYSFTGILPFQYSSNGDLINIGLSGFTGDNSNLIITDTDNTTITRNINSFVSQNLTSSNKYFTLTGTKENTSGINLTGQYFQAGNTPLNPYQNYLTGDLQALYRYPRDFVFYDVTTAKYGLAMWNSGSGAWFASSNLYGGTNGTTPPSKGIIYPVLNPSYPFYYYYRWQNTSNGASVWTPTIGTGYQRLPYEQAANYYTDLHGFTKMYKPLTLSFSSGVYVYGPREIIYDIPWPGKTTNYGYPGTIYNVNENLGMFTPYVFYASDNSSDSLVCKIYLDFSINKWVASFNYIYADSDYRRTKYYHGPTNTGQNPFPAVFNFISGLNITDNDGPRKIVGNQSVPQNTFEVYISSGIWTGVFTKNDTAFNGIGTYFNSSTPIDTGFKNYWNSRGY